MARRSKTKKANSAAAVNKRVPGAHFISPGSDKTPQPTEPAKAETLPTSGNKFETSQPTELPEIATLSITDTKSTTPEATEPASRPTLFFNNPSCPVSGFLSPEHEGRFGTRSGLMQAYIIPNRDDEDGVSNIPGREKGNRFFSIEQSLRFAKEVVHKTGNAQSVVDSQSEKAMRKNAEVDMNEPIFATETSRPLIHDLLKFALYSKFGDGETKFVTKDGAAMVCKLLDTGNKELVYANPRDKVLGIGFAAEGRMTTENALQCRQEWGENLLGLLLEELREQLRPKEAEWRDIKDFKW